MTDRHECVICNAPITPGDSGLCDDHKYEEQTRWRPCVDGWIELLEQIGPCCTSSEDCWINDAGDA